jgi:transaldolase
MKPTQQLHDLGQSLWLDNITRTMLGDGTLAGYIEELSVTGLTSNPTIFDKAISGGDAYDAQIGELAEKLDDPEEIFFQLALADLRDATNLFKGVFERTARVDGYCSLEVSPKLADDTEATIEQAAKLHGEAGRENLFIKIPASDRVQRLMNEGARPQRLLWASTGTKDPDASDTLYVEGFASPFTVNTMPEDTLHAFADHGELGDPVPADGGDCEQTLAAFGAAGIDVDALAERLQEEGKQKFVDSWEELLKTISAQQGARA